MICVYNSSLSNLELGYTVIICHILTPMQMQVVGSPHQDEWTNLYCPKHALIENYPTCQNMWAQAPFSLTQKLIASRGAFHLEIAGGSCRGPLYNSGLGSFRPSTHLKPTAKFFNNNKLGKQPYLTIADFSWDEKTFFVPIEIHYFSPWVLSTMFPKQLVSCLVSFWLRTIWHLISGISSPSPAFLQPWKLLHEIGKSVVIPKWRNHMIVDWDHH